MRINTSFSSLQEIVNAVTQGSILKPILFNMHIWDSFYLIETCETANYVDDTNPCIAGRTVAGVINSLEKCAKILFKLFSDNFMKAKSDKSDLFLSTEAALVANINSDATSNSKIEKLLWLHDRLSN